MRTRTFSILATSAALTTLLACSVRPTTRIAFAVTTAPLVDDTTRAAARPRCPEEMVAIDDRTCIDRWEASVVEILPGGEERPHSPFEPVEGLIVRAVSRPDVFPQGYISATQASDACVASGKRLCRSDEWTRACRGPEGHTWGYGSRRVRGVCNDDGKNPLVTMYGYGRGRFTWPKMNDAALNQLPGTLSRTGARAGCTNALGVFDMVGNLHEWTADPGGTFQGGFYQDVASVGHGEGCGYVTTAHESRYHDYSTGFRCCADLVGETIEL